MAEARSQVGKRYWFRNPAAEICPSPSSLRHCTAAPASGFVVETVAADAFGSPWVRIRFDADGKSAYTRYEIGTARIAWTSEDPATHSRAARAAGLRAKYCTGGKLRIGFDEAAALRAWCFPDRVVTRERAGHKRELWVYKRRGSLSFEDGRLTAIQRRE